MTSSGGLAVVHLVRRVNGMGPYESFLSSYERYEAGLEHDLVLLFKGFEDRSAAVPYLERISAGSPDTVYVPDTGFDLRAYLAAAHAVSHRRICFLNSFSEIRAPGWLALLNTALHCDPDVAGASGSWSSPLSYGLFQLGLGGAYRKTLENRVSARRAMHELSGASYRGDLAHWLQTLHSTAIGLRGMSRFPSVHVRTNAFVIERRTLCGLRSGRLNTKRSAYEFENGPKSMTSQIRARGGSALVIDSAGTMREPSEWPEGNVFWQGAQDELLVADNQTRAYANATQEQRTTLSAYAWGSKAHSSVTAP